jgi:outer membrane receptor protein involved in Fe transport
MLSGNAYFRRTITNTLNGDVNDDMEEYERNTTGIADKWASVCNGTFDLGLANVNQYTTNGKSGPSYIDATKRELFCTGRTNYTDTRKTSAGFTLQASSNQKFFDKENQITVGVAFDYSKVNFSQYGQYGMVTADRGISPVSLYTDAEDDSPKLRGRTYDWGLYGSDTISLNQKLNLTLAGRYNNSNVDNKDPNDPLHIDELHPENSLTGHHVFQRFNPSLGLTYNPSSDLKIYTAYSESNRAPTSMELGCANPAVPCKLPNAMASDPPLKQVVNRSVDLGVKGALTKDINWSVGTYVSLNSDDIQFLTAPGASLSQGGYFSNVGDTLRKGIDFGLNGQISKFRWSANYSFIKATYEDSFTIASDHNTEKKSTDCNGASLGTNAPTGVYTSTAGTTAITPRTNYGICVNPGSEIPGIPNHQFKLRTDFQATPNWNIGATAMIFSDQWLNGVENNIHRPRASSLSPSGSSTTSYQGTGRAGGYGVLNLDTRYKFNDSGWVAFARINNVFDRDYNTGGLQGATMFDTSGAFIGDDNRRSLFAPGAPRAAWMGMRYEFGGAKKSSDD